MDSWLKGHFSDWDAFRCCETQLFCAADCKKHRFPESPGNQTKWLVFRMIPVKDSLQPAAQSLVLAWTFSSRRYAMWMVKPPKTDIPMFSWYGRTHPHKFRAFQMLFSRCLHLNTPKVQRLEPEKRWEIPSSVHLLCLRVACPLLCMLKLRPFLSRRAQIW